MMLMIIALSKLLLKPANISPQYTSSVLSFHKLKKARGLGTRKWNSISYHHFIKWLL